VKSPGVNALRNAFKTDCNSIAQTTSEGAFGCNPDTTGQGLMHLVVEVTYVNFTPPKMVENEGAIACYKGNPVDQLTNQRRLGFLERRA